MLIGLCGRARAGKDTVADFLQKDFGFERYALASAIKKALPHLLGMEAKAVEEWPKEEVIPWVGKSPRQLLQTLGTEWGRECVHEDIWVRVMLRRWGYPHPQGPLRLVVTDVRFDNEAKAIREAGGRIIKVVRPGQVSVAEHASESGISVELIDHTILNGGCLEDLRAYTTHAVKQLQSMNAT